MLISAQLWGRASLKALARLVSFLDFQFYSVSFTSHLSFSSSVIRFLIPSSLCWLLLDLFLLLGFHTKKKTYVYLLAHFFNNTSSPWSMILLFLVSVCFSSYPLAPFPVPFFRHQVLVNFCFLSAFKFHFTRPF